jgi:hypothetical protein
MNNLSASVAADAYIHIRVIIGIILGLSLSKLLTGVAGFIQHPSRQRVYAIHMIWVGFAFVSVIHFWWFEFYLSTVERWTFGLYVFVILYASLYYLLCALLFPDKMDDYIGYGEYFMSRRRWFFGVIAAIFMMDLADTAIKGFDRFSSFGVMYPARNFIYAGVALVAIFIDNQRFQLAAAALLLFFQILWILRAFSTLG